MRGIFAPETVPEQKPDTELDLMAANPDILLSMVHVARGSPSQKLLAAARHIRCPTLFVHGEHDALVPQKHARLIHERIVEVGGHSRFVLMPGAGHMLVLQGAPELASFVLDVLKFCAPED
jgi:pimeloyl-ACP methyl ester carboxylesterase